MTGRLSKLRQGIFGFTTIIALVTCTVLSVQAAPPTTGAVLEGAKPPAAAQPPAAKAPDITIEGGQPQIQADGQAKIPVQGFRIGGEPPLPADELLALVKDQAGRELTLSELGTLAGKLTQHLRGKGYLVAFAYIPAQDIVGGIVEIAVIPGKYGQVKIAGSGRFDAGRLRAMLHEAKAGAVITRGPLERALLILSDLNGVSIKATLAPGEAAGTADLLLEVADAARVRGVAYADNWGNRFTSRNRFGIQAIAGNLGGRGDDLLIGGLVTENSRMNNYNLGYSFLWGDDGARVSFRHSKVDYTLGENYASLGATGQAKVTTAEIAYPLIRSRAFSLYGNISCEDKRLQDNQTASDSYVPKKNHIVSIGLAGNYEDNWLGGGNSAFSVTHYKGRLTIGDASTASSDDATAKTAGDFSKTILTFQRRQYIAANLSLHLNITGQLAGKNLDSSEKLFLGGADGVRAFPQGEAAGDDGYKLTGELRWRLPWRPTAKDNVYLAGFYDYGSVIVNHNPWAGAGGSNRRSLMGVGLGLLWTHTPDFSIRLDYAWKLGGEQATADTDKNGRFWLQGVKYF